MSTQTQQSQVHPRRRPYKAGIPSLSTSSASDHPDPKSSSPCPRTPRLQRGATFHSPTTPPREDQDPVLNIPSLPRRSPTCTKTLEAIAAGEQRMANILGRFDFDSLSPSKPTDRQEEDDLPVPRGILQAHVGQQRMQTPRKEHSLPTPPADTPNKVQTAHHRHASDSGLGSSISSTAANERVKAGHLSTGNADLPGGQSAITHSISSGDTSRRQLPLAACKQIERFILAPILREERLKPFHPLVRSIPQRIVDKEITCLRDLEKTLLWLAPQYSITKASYLGFCEFTIQSIHTAVTHLNERDQRLPTDRPYTNGYFLDLVAQIRQYAAMIAASRERARARGEQADATSEERLTLEGGLSQTGRPAELVCHKDDKAISLRTGEPYDEKAVPTMKRTLSNQSMDEGVARSMARRKKNAPPMDINQKCRDCDKVFKRPCDLTKHEKTHSRPWKCTEPSCKYFEIGWPTEKERDRHMNDRHSQSPALFKCKFAPCTYQSKRESNCKQHMEKAHGWVYIRSKSNGKNKKASSVSSAQPTPQTPAMSTPSNSTDVPTPVSGPAPSPYDPFTGLSANQQFSFAEPPVNPNTDFQLFPDVQLLDNTFDDVPMSMDDFNTVPTSLDFSAFQAQLEAGNPDDLIPAMDMYRPSMSSNGSLESMGSSSIFDNSALAVSENIDSMGAPSIFDNSPLAVSENVESMGIFENTPLTTSENMKYDSEWAHNWYQSGDQYQYPL
ncbi:hypothetical protein VTN96DRAFT_5878 [Rasamsonia emersonii]|uniref:Zinc finger transcription factor ACE I n=1 Tax=Rasamsonia emersonii (strain ATCC 16479 / CBS 393.64 / IMI 116815) TaxID=1408163 RepID=A0A0F4Z6M2_RASE3|nr:Zinc finger transcription factor ACE I [Rasamsonia emersonii CBS 393.64]KKA25533.1 Zinc finger transcription factor ACE I [Rasamsonia emersonii CBS 393.64]